MLKKIIYEWKLTHLAMLLKFWTFLQCKQDHQRVMVDPMLLIVLTYKLF